MEVAGDLAELISEAPMAAVSVEPSRLALDSLPVNGTRRNSHSVSDRQLGQGPAICATHAFSA